VFSACADGELSSCVTEIEHQIAGEYAFRIMPAALSRLQNLREMGLVRCGAHGFAPGFAGMTKLETLAVVDPSPPRHMKFPRDLSRMTRLAFVDIGCQPPPFFMITQ